jgi:hypothetical protein
MSFEHIAHICVIFNFRFVVIFTPLLNFSTNLQLVIQRGVACGLDPLTSTHPMKKPSAEAGLFLLIQMKFKSSSNSGGVRCAVCGVRCAVSLSRRLNCLAFAGDVVGGQHLMRHQIHGRARVALTVGPNRWGQASSKGHAVTVTQRQQSGHGSSVKGNDVHKQGFTLASGGPHFGGGKRFTRLAGHGLGLAVQLPGYQCVNHF